MQLKNHIITSNSPGRQRLSTTSTQESSAALYDAHAGLIPTGTTFKEAIEHIVGCGIRYIDDIPAPDVSTLIAAYLREADEIERWEFITEPEGSDKLPLLLINLLEADSIKHIDNTLPALILAFTMVQSALKMGRYAIESGLKNAVC